MLNESDPDVFAGVSRLRTSDDSELLRLAGSCLIDEIIGSDETSNLQNTSWRLAFLKKKN